ncbi:YdcF family protein [Candidatus Saganbacteria bacterium]|nr:YdcF family protein [Candidatus Saganbacteria bacterium]
MKKSLIVFLILMTAAIVFHPVILNGMAKFLYVRDKLEKSDVILVLAGDSNGERAAHGVDLYKKGFAPKILMSGGPAIWHLTYAENMRNQATSLGVPAKDVLLQDRSRSTFEDIKFSLLILKKIDAKKVILVTSPTHIRRSRLVARKFFKKEGIKVMASPVEKSEFNPNKWWTRHEDTQYVVWEYVSLIGYMLKGKLF